MRDNWQLVVALAIIAAWAARFIVAGPGIGMSLWFTSAGLLVAFYFLVSWWLSRRRRRTSVGVGGMRR